MNASVPPRRPRLPPWLLRAVAAVALGHYLVLALLGDPFNIGTLLSLLVAFAAGWSGAEHAHAEQLARGFPPMAGTS